MLSCLPSNELDLAVEIVAAQTAKTHEREVVPQAARMVERVEQGESATIVRYLGHPGPQLVFEAQVTVHGGDGDDCPGELLRYRA